MKKIISVSPIEKVFSITWMLGRRCNYDCMYCAPEWHDKVSKHHGLGKLKQAWQNIHQQTETKQLSYKISFTGGEVTANKNFLPFVSWLKNNYNVSQILITTNGSAGLKYYEKLTNYVDAISFSTHTEFMDEKVFFQKATAVNKLMVRPKKSFHVNIMDEHWAKERIKLYQRFCVRHQISFSVNEINYTRKTREQIYNNGRKNLEI